MEIHGIGQNPNVVKTDEKAAKAIRDSLETNFDKDVRSVWKKWENDHRIKLVYRSPQGRLPKK